MQGLSAKTLQRRTRLRAQPRGLCFKPGPVGRIAKNRMPNVSEMDPDLVGTPCLQGACDEADDRLPVGSKEVFQHLPVGHSRTATRAHGLLLPGMGVAPNRGLDRAFPAVRCPPDQGEIPALERSLSLLRKLLRESAMSLIGLGDDHEAGCVLVETVHDARSLDPPDA